MSTEKTYRQDPLWSAFGFSEDDLVANRSGQMTKEQRRKLFKQLHNTVLIFIGLILLILFVFSLGQAPTDDQRCFKGILIAVVSYLGVHTALNLLIDIYRESVDKVCGFVALDAHAQYRSFRVQYQLRVREVYFALNKAQFLAIRNGELYCIYYAPKSRCILSMEAQ